MLSRMHIPEFGFGRTTRLRNCAVVALCAAATVPVFVARASASGGVGVYPTRVDVAHAFRGSQLLKTIGVIDDTGTALTFDATMSGAIASWATFGDVNDPSHTLTSVRVQGRGQIALRLRVPDDAADGTYSGTVHLLSEPLANDAGRAATNQAVRVGADVPVTVAVDGTQIVRGSLLDSQALNAIEAGYPLRVKNVVANYGNVGIRPQFDFTITHNGGTVATFTAADSAIDPGATQSIEADWRSARSSDLGSYVAHIAASFQGVALGSRDVRFEVVPYGSLRRAGTFDGLAVLNHPRGNEAAHVQAVFHNTGQIETNVLFDGVLKRGPHTVRAVRSVPVFADVGASRTLDFYVNVGSGGKYSLVGKLSFEGRQTAERTATFPVAGSKFNWVRAVGLVLLVLAAVALCALVYRRRSRRQRRLLRTRSARAPERIRVANLESSRRRELRAPTRGRRRRHSVVDR